MNVAYLERLRSSLTRRLTFSPSPLLPLLLSFPSVISLTVALLTLNFLLIFFRVPHSFTTNINMKSHVLFLGMIGGGGVLAGAVSSSSSWGAGWGTNNTSIWYTTITTTAFTTYCPQATVLTHGGIEYTVTEATTLTITDCPCTLVQVCFHLPLILLSLLFLSSFYFL